MPDLLTHVLVAYAFFRLLSLRERWLTAPSITIGMVGALIPDLSKAYLVLPNRLLTAIIGLPFDWQGVHTIGGVVVVAMIGALVVGPDSRRRVFILLFAGSVTHLILDAAIMEPTGFGYPALWPLTRFRLPSLNLYRSTDIWPATVGALIAAAAYAVSSVIRTIDEGR